jgi:hypothetical protein
MGPGRRRRAAARAGLAVVLLGLAAAPMAARAGEFSAEYRAGLRRTAELRRQWRASRASRPVGTIAAWPVPPALIIRQTPAAHDEVRGWVSFHDRSGFRFTIGTGVPPRVIGPPSDPRGSSPGIGSLPGLRLVAWGPGSSLESRDVLPPVAPGALLRNPGAEGTVSPGGASRPAQIPIDPSHYGRP